MSRVFTEQQNTYFTSFSNREFMRPAMVNPLPDRGQISLTHIVLYQNDDEKLCGDFLEL